MGPLRDRDAPTSTASRGIVARVRAILADQRIAFLVVGGLNTVIGLGWFFLIHLVAKDAIGYMVTLVLAYALGTVSGFILHRRFVFRVTGTVAADLARFAVVNATGLAVNSALLPLFVEVIGLDVAPAQLLATALTVVMTYVGHRSFSFRRHEA
jgi:putative flippase GtrA